MIANDMLDKILKTVGTTTGIGGIALTVLWFIYGEALNEKFLSRVSSEVSGLLIGSIILLSFLIAIIALFVGVQIKNNSSSIFTSILFIVLVVIILLFILAVVYLITQVDIKSSSKDNILQQGYSLYKVGEYDKASNLFTTAGESEPNNFAIWYWSAMTELKLGNHGIAKGYVEKALEINPQDPYSLIFKIKLLLLKGGNNIAKAKELGQKLQPEKLVNNWLNCIRKKKIFDDLWVPETTLEKKCPSPIYNTF